MKSFFVLAFVLLIFMPLASYGHVLQEKASKYGILDALLDPKRYDPRIRPDGIKATESPVIVKVSIYILDVYQEDPYLKDFKVQCYFRQKWFDNRLVSRGTSGEVDLKDTSKIWIPDLIIVDEVTSYTHDTFVPNKMVSVYPNGEVLLSNRLTAVLKCKTDLKYYPHDQQKCRINVESFGSYLDDLSIEWDSYPHLSGFNLNISHDKYILLDFATRKSIQNVDNVKYDILHVDFLFSRSFSPFLWSLYLPYIIFVAMSWWSFSLPPEKPLMRLAFLTLILILMLHLSPDFHYFRNDVYHITALDFWVLGCLSFIVAEFLEYLYVHRLMCRNKDDALPPEENMENCVEKSMTTREKMEVAFIVFKERSTSKSYWKSYIKDYRKMDNACRNVLFPVGFLLFNIMYWSVCYSGQCSSLSEWDDESN